MAYADNKGVKIYYESWGSGVPIVFLHPWSTNGYIWYFQIFHFAQTNTCVTVDHRGHGRSDKPAKGYSIQEHASDVAAVMDAANIDKAVIVGNSIGGMIAMQFCLARPERVLGLVIQSSGTALSEGLPKEVMEAMIRDRDATFN
jgi:pimeloyl-ACP methyl ester carboxylesterase